MFNRWVLVSMAVAALNNLKIQLSIYRNSDPNIKIKIGTFTYQF